ncbi:MAG: phage holin family protein [Betaproteobacteria bacterium]|nr:MAG: phage holin family protein [Betaproteobacteria bacterium]
MADGEGAAARGGLLHSIRRMAGSLLGAAQTRLEILATEIEEERLRLEQLLLIALAAAFCLAFGVALAIALAVLYFWDTHRLFTVGLLAAAFLGAGVALGWVLRAKVTSRPKPFAVTRGELAKDGALLRGPRQ